MNEHEHYSTEEHMHHGGNAKYLAVFACLIVLTAISFWLGSSSLMETSPAVGRAGMMAVSCAKALLVMLFFMHLIWEANWKYVLTIPASLMSVFLVIMLTPDIAFRTHKYSLERWKHASESAPPAPRDEGHDHPAEEHRGETEHAEH